MFSQLEHKLQLAQPLHGCCPGRRCTRCAHQPHTRCTCNIARWKFAQKNVLFYKVPDGCTGEIWSSSARDSSTVTASRAELLFCLQLLPAESLSSSLKDKILMKLRCKPTYIEAGSAPSGRLMHHWFVQLHKREQIRLQYRVKQEFSPMHNLRERFKGNSAIAF